MVRSPRCSLLLLLRIFIIVVCGIGVASVFAAFFMLKTSGPTLRGFIVVVGIVLLIVSMIAWRVTSMEAVGRRPINNVFLQAYRAEYFDREVSECAARHPAFLPFSYPTSRTSPRPLLMPPTMDPLGPPTMLAPPPPPPPRYSELDFNNRSSAADVAQLTGCAPPIYTVCGVLSRRCSTSPPPGYCPVAPLTTAAAVQGNHELALSVIDCSKATPTMFHFPAAQCSTI